MAVQTGILGDCVLSTNQECLSYDISTRPAGSTLANGGLEACKAEGPLPVISSQSITLC